MPCVLLFSAFKCIYDCRSLIIRYDSCIISISDIMIFFLQTIMLIYSLQSWSFPSYDVNTKFTVGKNFDDGGGINRIEADQFLNALKLKIPPLLLNCNTSLISEWFRIIGKVKESDMMSKYLNEDFSFNKIDDVNRRLYAGRIMNRDRQRNYDHHKNQGQFHYYKLFTKFQSLKPSTYLILKTYMFLNTTKVLQLL